MITLLTLLGVGVVVGVGWRMVNGKREQQIIVVEDKDDDK